MHTVKTINRKMLMIYMAFIISICIIVIGKLIYLMVYKSEYYGAKALEIQERERKIKAPRGEILDRNGKVIASNKTVCTISVIYNQVKETEKVIEILEKRGNLQINTLVVEADIPVQKMNTILFELEMKGVVHVLVGGMYQLL